MGESLFWEAAEGRDDDPDVRTCTIGESYRGPDLIFFEEFMFLEQEHDMLN